MRMCIAMDQLGIEASSFKLEVKRNQPIYDSTLVNDYELLKQDYMNFVEQGKNYMPPTNKNAQEDADTKEFTAFGRDLTQAKRTIQEKIEGQFSVENDIVNEKISGLNMGMQVYLNYKRRRFAMSPHVGMMIALTYTLIPIIYKLISKENFFIKENMIIFACFFFSIFSLSMLNWAMLKLLEIFFDMKLMFKKNIISMLDPKFAI